MLVLKTLEAIEVAWPQDICSSTPDGTISRDTDFILGLVGVELDSIATCAAYTDDQRRSCAIGDVVHQVLAEGVGVVVDEGGLEAEADEVCWWLGCV